MNVWRGSFQFVRFTNLEAPINFGTTHNEWDVRFSRRPVRKWTFWDIAECTLVEAYRCLRYAYFLHRQVSDPPSQYPLRLSSWHVITYPRLLCDHEDIFLKSVSRKKKPDVEEGQSQSPHNTTGGKPVCVCQRGAHLQETVPLFKSLLWRILARGLYRPLYYVCFIFMNLLNPPMKLC
jgi:hypothetical protein